MRQTPLQPGTLLLIDVVVQHPDGSTETDEVETIAEAGDTVESCTEEAIEHARGHGLRVIGAYPKETPHVGN